MHKTFIIAEAGINHNGNIGKAMQLVKIAKLAGADAVKFQLFDMYEQLSTFAKVPSFQKKRVGNISMMNMAKSYYLPWSAHIKIKKYCKKLKIQYLASCFDDASINFYVKILKTKTIKIGSGEITNFSLLKKSTELCNRVILSTGMSTIEEVKNALKVLRTNKKTKIDLLHCISDYPTKNENLNLKCILTLKNKFKLDTGFSDHSLGFEGAMISLGLGAKIIEKHFTINKKLKGPDHSMSLDPNELKVYISKIREAEKILGNGIKLPNSNEIKLKKLVRRGVFSSRKIKKGEKITKFNTCVKRPIVGIPSEKINSILGKLLKKDINKNEPIFINYIKQ